MELAIARPMRNDEQWYEVLTDIASESNPHGMMFHPSLLHDALKLGAIAGEGMISSFTMDGEDIMGEFDFNDLQLEARAVQANDMQKFLASVLYTEHIGKVLKTFRVNGEPIYDREIDGKPIWKSPELWESHVNDEHRVDIINEAKANLKNNQRGLVFDVTMEEANFTDESGKTVLRTRLIINQEVSHSERGRKPMEQKLRNSLGSIGFAMMVGGNTILKGKNARLAISPEAALNMFALLENARLFTRMTWSSESFLNKSMGVKLSNDGRKVLAIPVQDVMRDALGYTARGIREANLNTSEALLRVAGEESGVMMARDSRSTMLGREIRVVDLDHYTMARHIRGEGMATTWVES